MTTDSGRFVKGIIAQIRIGKRVIAHISDQVEEAPRRSRKRPRTGKRPGLEELAVFRPRRRFPGGPCRGRRLIRYIYDGDKLTVQVR